MADNYWPLVVLLSLLLLVAVIIGGFGVLLLFRSEFLAILAEKWVSSKIRRTTQLNRHEELQVRLSQWGTTILRVGTGILFLMSGGHKLFPGAFGEAVRTLGQSQNISLSLLIATTGTLIEFLCGAALVVGLFTRWAAIPLAIVMAFDLLLFHPPSGFFVEDSGYEHALLRLIACVALVVAGPGRAALGSLLASWVKSMLPR